MESFVEWGYLGLFLSSFLGATIIPLSSEIVLSLLLTQGFDELDEAKFYFVHSYFVKVEDEENSILKSNHGVEFDCAIQKDNIYGAQFHPEKSHKFGMKLFENFAKI